MTASFHYNGVELNPETFHSSACTKPLE